MKNPGRMENVTRQFVATLLSLSMVILLASAAQAAINCTQCHGDGSSSSAPIDTLATSASYRNITTGAVKGNHNTHSGAVMVGQPCARCHGAAAASYTTSHAILKHYSIQMSASMNYNRGAGVVTAFKQTSSPTLGTCSTVNCHFETITPTWGQTVTWTSQKGASSDASSTCTQCHVGAGLNTGKHNKHILFYNNDLTSCSKCHPDYYTPAGAPAFSHATSNTGSIKMNFATGSLRTSSTFLPGAATNSAATCSATYCHKGASVTPAWNGAATNCASCHGSSNNGDLSGGASTGHAKHYQIATPQTAITDANGHTTSAYVFACLNCHPTATHVQGAADSTGPVFQDAEINGTKLTSGNYTQGGSSTTDAKTFNYTNGTCSTVCHTKDGVTLGSGVVPAPAWDGVNALGCGYCHSKAGDGSPTWTTPHTKHINDYSVNTSFTCEACHTGTAASNSALQATTQARTQHPDGTKNVQFGAFAGGSMSGAQCQNTYCHSTGQSTTGSHGLISWTGTMNADCSSCHGGNSTAGAAAIKTYVHAQHLYSTNRLGKTIGCKDCHAATVSGDGTISSYTNHVDKNVNVKFDNVINKNADAPTYVSGTPTTTANGAAKTPGTGGYTCNNLYCHSTGNLGTSGNLVSAGTVKFRSVAWNSAAIGCDGCHGGGGKSHPIYTSGLAGYSSANSHVKHVESSQLGCDYCHYNTVTQAGTNPTRLRMNNFSGHLNRTADIRFKLNAGKTGSYTPGNAGAATKTCSNTYCHGVGPSIAWGGTSTCDSCHSANPLSASGNNRFWNSYSTAHRMHLEVNTLPVSYSTYSGNVSTTSAYRFSCAACHTPTRGATHSTGVASANRAAEVFFQFTTAGKSGSYVEGTTRASQNNGLTWTNGTCNNTYCHSDGQGGLPKKTAFTWASPQKTIRCYGCHGGDQNAAMSGYSTIRTYGHARHVDARQNTELGVGNGIDCSRCHAKTVSQSYASYSSVAGLNKKNHVNKMRDYSGINSNPNGGNASNGQFNAAAKTCSNVYCHSNSKVGVANFQLYANPAAWNSGIKNRNCNYCHGRENNGSQYDSTAAFKLYSSTGVPNYVSGSGGSATANSHRQHILTMGSTDYSNTQVCYSCHSATLDSSTGRTMTAAKFRAYSSRHTSGTYNVKMNGVIGGSYLSGVGNKTCSSVSCHGSGVTTPQWGANTNDDTCVKCHGTAGTASGTITDITRYLVAPPRNTAGTSGTVTSLVSNNPKVGAHQTHLRYQNGFSNYSTSDFMCRNCHAMPPSGAHADGNSLPSFQLMAKNRGAMSPVWTPASLTCSNTYCHNPAASGGSLNTANTGALTFVSWTASSYIPGAGGKSQANCGKCHKVPGDAGFTSSGNHTGVDYTAGSCTGCHGHDGNNQGSSTAGRRHIDGIKYGGGSGCNGCHAYDAADWASASSNYGGQNQGKGAHAKHIAYLKARNNITLDPSADFTAGYDVSTNVAAVCGVCHSTNIADHTTGVSTNPRNINFNSATTYQFGASTPTYNGVYNSSSATNPKSCSNVSCHFLTSPIWSTY